MRQLINIGKRIILSFLVMIVPLTVLAVPTLIADGVYLDGTTLYISRNVTSLPDLQLNPTDIYCYAITPPACTENTFTGYDGTLHVPRSAMVAYFSALYWNNFNNYSTDAVEPESVSLSQESVTLEKNNQVTLTATVTPADATPNYVTWSSSNTSVATVENGKVKAVGYGECDITASCFDKTAVCHVTVPAHIVIHFIQHEVSIKPNETIYLTAYCEPVTTALTASSSDPAVARATYVDGIVKVDAIGEGTAIVTISSVDGLATPDTCVVRVYTLAGDVNADGSVNISDVTRLIDYLLNPESVSISMSAADTNSDGNVSISDVTHLIDYLLSGEWPTPHGDSPTLTFEVNDISFTMVLVEGGTFTMGAYGSLLDDATSFELPAHEVTITRNYYMCEIPVTQELWTTVMGSNPSYFFISPLYPVLNVSWDACQQFITKLNQLTGQSFRLPTEAEWEFAARGGNLSHGYMYAGSDNIDEVAWYHDNTQIGSSFYPHNVGQKQPNELGLYDMSGNAWEWCQDYYGDYSSESQTDPTGPETGIYRIARGGSADQMAKACRVSARNRNTPTMGMLMGGLRLAL